MKKIFTFIILVSSLPSFAQKEGSVVLNKGQKFTITSSVSSDIDMGMGMPIKNSSTSASQVVVLFDDDKKYTISNTVTKMTVTSDVMGQQTNYDSDKQEDKDSELGKKLSTTINKSDTILVEKTTGNTTKKNDSPERPEKGSEDNPFGDLMSGGNADVGVTAAFFVIPKDKKVGDSWSDSTSTKDMKTVKTYTIKSMDKDIATVLVNMNMNGSFETDMEGTSIPFTMNVKSSGEMTVDVKKSLVNKFHNDIDISGSFEVMGQTMPITAKGSSSAAYQY